MAATCAVVLNFRRDCGARSAARRRGSGRAGLDATVAVAALPQGDWAAPVEAGPAAGVLVEAGPEADAPEMGALVEAVPAADALAVDGPAGAAAVADPAA